MTPNAAQRIEDHLSQPLPTETIVLELPDLPGTREWIHQFAQDHVSQYVYVPVRGQWYGSRLLAGITAVLNDDIWRITATMVKPPSNIELPISIVPLDEAMRTTFTPFQNTQKKQ
jgi:hypothetical protein